MGWDHGLGIMYRIAAGKDNAGAWREAEHGGWRGGAGLTTHEEMRL
jgi:hypothetical protein